MRLLGLIMPLLLLVGACSNPKVDAEKRLAEAEQKLEEATKALEEARKSAAAAQVEQAQDSLKAEANSLEKAAIDTKAAAQGESDAAAAAARLRKAAAAEAKAAEARKLAAPVKTYTVAEGTKLPVRMESSLSTKTATVGQSFQASLAAPLRVDDYVVAEKGANVEGVVTESDPGGRVKGRAVLGVRLRKLQVSGGEMVDLETQPLVLEAQGTKKKDAMKVGIASGIGAAIGAIAGGGKGAAIGAGAGAAGGTGVVLATRGDAAVLPVETLLTFRLTKALTVEGKRK